MSALPGSATRETGARYEDLADAYLQRAGLAPLARNFNCRHGELDLVMRDGDVVVFVEVRYRRKGATGHFGDGIDSVGASKRARLVRAAGRQTGRGAGRGVVPGPAGAAGARRSRSSTTVAGGSRA